MSLVPESWRRAWQRKRLRDPAFAFLFDAAPPDEWVALDCETTGLDVRRDEIIAIAAVRIVGDTLLTSQRLERLVRPTGPVSAESVRVHRLRERDVAAGMPAQQAVKELLRFIGSRPIVGYYTEFDVTMIDRVLKPMIGIGLPQKVIDVGTLFHHYQSRYRTPHQQLVEPVIDLRFETLMRTLDLPQRPAHDALNDAVMAALAFIKLRKLNKS